MRLRRTTSVAIFAAVIAATACSASSLRATAITSRSSIDRQALIAARTVLVATPAAPTCPYGTAIAHPTTEAIFNDPSLGTASAQDRIVTQMEDLICSARLSTPTNPSSIEIATTSFRNAPAQQLTADLLWAKQRKHVAIRLVLDGSMTAANAPGIQAGTEVSICGHGGTDDACAGDTVMHTKLLVMSKAGSAPDVVLLGSQNDDAITEQQQFNDAIQVVGNLVTYHRNLRYFNKLFANCQVPDLGDLPALTESETATPAGPGVESFFFPRNRSAAFPDSGFDASNDKATDTVGQLLSHVRCTSPGSHAHIRGKTLVRVAIFDFGKRPEITKALTAAAKDGCQVQLLYTVIDTASTYKQLHAAGVTLTQVADADFHTTPAATARCVYLHDKFIAISGNYAGHPNRDIVISGSENFTQVALHDNDDELSMVTENAASKDKAVFTAYDREWMRLHAFGAAHPGDAGGCGSTAGN